MHSPKITNGLNLVAQFQHKHFIPVAVFAAFLLPTMVCWLWNDATGGLLWGGFVLRVLIWHSIFCINSFAHFYGTQEFSKTISARGNWVLALVAAGEGHHNFHHEFPHDYRNGVSRFDYDPTKWAIYLSSILGWAHDLKSVPDDLISKARAQAASNHKARELPAMGTEEFHAKVKAGAMYLILDGRVVDVSSYLEEHPGGAGIIQSFIGQDATDAFHGGLNAHSQTAHMLMQSCCVAELQA